jgi:hypothetical protein
MLEPHQRAALLPNGPGLSWHHFLAGRFVGTPGRPGGAASFACVVGNIQAQEPGIAEIRGWIEQSSGPALPIVSEFVGVLNLETREISFQLAQPATAYNGQISENGRVMVLRQTGQARPLYLVHEETLAELI